MQIGAVVLYLFVVPVCIYNERHETKEDTENISMDFMTRSWEKMQIKIISKQHSQL